MHPNSEQKLVEACLRHDCTAQRALYNRYAPYMLSMALRYVTDADTAQDIVQEAFIKVFTSLNQYAGKGSLEGWIRRILVNVALESLRRNNVHFDSIDSDEVLQIAETNESVIERLSADDLMELISTLPTGFRTVFNMYAIEGYSHKEIAQELGIQESSSRSQYLRAKSLIQKKLEELK